MRIFRKIAYNKGYPRYLVEKLREIDELREEDRRLEKLLEQFKSRTPRNTELLYNDRLKSIAKTKSWIKRRINEIFTQIERFE